MLVVVSMKNEIWDRDWSNCVTGSRVDMPVFITTKNRMFHINGKTKELKSVYNFLFLHVLTLSIPCCMDEMQKNLKYNSSGLARSKGYACCLKANNSFLKKLTVGVSIHIS